MRTKLDELITRLDGAVGEIALEYSYIRDLWNALRTAGPVGIAAAIAIVGAAKVAQLLQNYRSGFPDTNIDINAEQSQTLWSTPLPTVSVQPRDFSNMITQREAEQIISAINEAKTVVLPEGSVIQADYRRAVEIYNNPDNKNNCEKLNQALSSLDEARIGLRNLVAENPGMAQTYIHSIEELEGACKRLEEKVNRCFMDRAMRRGLT